jgi:hypothetical protein
MTDVMFIYVYIRVFRLGLKIWNLEFWVCGLESIMI